jgi:catechol 2,3-dioxygenase-like lactoylglutathione lyase family enzyme
VLSALPLISVADVPASSRFYQQILGAASGHGGEEYEQVMVDGEIVMQLHALDVGHHHGPLGDPSVPLGNGLALWFTTEEFDDAVDRVRASGAEIVTDVHVNPNSGCREIWLRDPDGYLVVLAQTFAPDRQRRED